MQHLLEILGAGLFALAGAALILLGVARWIRAPDRPADRPEPAAFLFEGPELVDASPVARHLLDDGQGPADLPSLLRLLSRSFGADLADRIAALAPAGRLRLASPGAGTLEAEADGTRLRLTLHPGKAATSVDRLSLEAAREELALLRGIAEAAPQPIWTLDPAGRIVWANCAYRDLAERTRDSARRADDAPSAMPLFPVPEGPAEGDILQRREALPFPGRAEPMWFEVTTVPRGSGTLHFASDVGALVLAEAARLHFVQALAKTFAHLATGLAIFDQQRRLVLFNPAFMDLTGLPIEFLSGRPLVHSVLDRLRETGMLPEPRDYAAWREEVAQLEAAAARGAYNDTWNLPGGRTYRVTGRPHPDGALALLFEDISGEVGRVRHLRAELDTTRAALEALEEPAAVFAAPGTLSLSNAAYAELWGAPPIDADLCSELARWQSDCAPSALGSLAKDLPRTFRTELLHRLDGRTLCLRLTPLPQGASLATFRAAPASRTAEAPAGLGTLDQLHLASPALPASGEAPNKVLLALEDV